MIRQYAPQRFRYHLVGSGKAARLIEVGTIPVGTIFRCQSSEGRTRGQRSMIVDAWLPREIGAGRRVGTRYENSYVARGGHLALVRCLASGETKTLADHFIRFCVDNA